MAGEAKEFWQRFLPNQSENRKLAPESGKPFEQELFDFVGYYNSGYDYSDLKLHVPPHMPPEAMATDPVTISFIQFLVQLHRPMRLIEIGTYIGISAIRIADVMPSGAQLKTLEKGAEFAALARRNIFDNKPTQAVVEVYETDALEMISHWASIYTNAWVDFVFLDADKENYDLYLEPLGKLMKKGGLLVVDDVFFHGDALRTQPQTDKGRGCQKLLRKINEGIWSTTIIPLGNGLLLAQKPILAPHYAQNSREPQAAP